MHQSKKFQVQLDVAERDPLLTGIGKRPWEGVIFVCQVYLTAVLGHI